MRFAAVIGWIAFLVSCGNDRAVGTDMIVMPATASSVEGGQGGASDPRICGHRHDVWHCQ